MAVEDPLEEDIRLLAAKLGLNPDLLVQGFNKILDLVGVDCRHLGGEHI
jgi:hypothetical protein